MVGRRFGGCDPSGDRAEHQPRIRETRDSKDPDSSPDSKPLAPLPIKSDWAPIMEFTAADIFQHSLFGDILKSLKSLSYQESPGRTTVSKVGVRTMKKFKSDPPPTL